MEPDRYPTLRTQAIALLIPDFDRGGEETRVVLFANSYAAVFGRVYLLAPAGVSSTLLAPEVQHVATNVRHYGSLGRVLRLLRRQRVRFVQGHKRATLPYLLAAEKLLGCICVFNFDNIYPRYNRLLAPLAPRHVVYLSRELADFYAPYYPKRENQVINMGGEFYEPPTPGARARARQALGLANEQVGLLSLGRLSPQKNQQLLLRALRTRPAPNLVCLLAGTGPEEATLRRLVGEYGLTERVRFLGHVADPYPLLAAADVLVQSSVFEGFPNVFIEAASVGLPIIATDVGSARTLVARQGILVAAGAVGELADALATMQHHLATYRQRAAELRTSDFFQQFHKAAMVAGYLNYYASLVDSEQPK